jgi:hypothetical protein
MAAAGLATAATPFVLGHQAAGAAETSASDSETLQFVTFSGAELECTGFLTVVHDTDDGNQPALKWNLGLDGDDECRDAYTTDTTASYKDGQGTARTTNVFALGLSVGDVRGAYTNTSVTTVLRFDNCDPFHGLPCSMTLRASPK